MPELLQTCCVCAKGFAPQFTYQSEQQRTADGNVTTRYFCSQRCLGHSHQTQAALACDACGVGFTVTRGSQVIYLRAKRHYACSETCRAQLLACDRAGAPALANVVHGVSSQRPSSGLASDAVSTPAQGAGAVQATAPLPSVRPAHSAVAARSARSVDSPRPAAANPKAATQQSANPRLLAVFNHKGGTGKTTTAVTIAAGLAARGKRTLIVDTDAQGNVAISLGLNKISRSLYHVLVMGMPLTDAVMPARENLDVLASNETLAAAELYLAGRQNRDRILATRLAPAIDLYDYVVVDCSPSLSLLNQNALVFADSVLCPVACDYLSLVGVRQVVKTIKSVNRLLSHPVQLWGVLPTLYDRRARICNEALETLREHFAERCLPPVRSAIRVKEAPSQGKTVFEYDAGSDVAADYAATLDRIIAGHNLSAAHNPLTDTDSASDQQIKPLLAIA